MIKKEIKVCGMKYPLNIEEVSSLDIQRMGFIFYKKSQRDISVTIKHINFEKIPKYIKKVIVTVNMSITVLERNVLKYGFDMVQLHGDETPEYCQVASSFTTVMKAFSINEDFDFEKTKAYLPYCESFVFDAKGKYRGGNGMKYNWNILNNYQYGVPFFLSGGLNPNDQTAIQNFKHPKCIGIDLNSGFESQPSFKNFELLKNFI